MIWCIAELCSIRHSLCCILTVTVFNSVFLRHNSKCSVVRAALLPHHFFCHVLIFLSSQSEFNLLWQFLPWVFEVNSIRINIDSWDSEMRSSRTGFSNFMIPRTPKYDDPFVIYPLLHSTYQSIVFVCVKKCLKYFR